MSVALDYLTGLKKETEAIEMEKKPSIEEIRAALGLDKCQPIIASPSDAEDMDEKGDAFAEWNEQELRELYEQIRK